MEHDCEIFDDADAALDGLLAQARWDDADAQMTERLRATVLADRRPEPLVPAAVFAPSPGTPGEGWVEGSPAPDTSIAVPVLLEDPHSAAPGVPGEEESARAEIEPLRQLRMRPARFYTAMAACLAAIIGSTWLREVLSPQTSTAIAKTVPLPGRSPNPMELWYMSPAGHAHTRAVAQKKAMVDPQTTVARFTREKSPRELSALLVREHDADLRKAVLTELLQRPQGINIYLDLVLNPKTRDSALSALHLLPKSAQPLLLAQLDSPSVSRRFAAAKALGSLCHGQMLPELQKMIESNNHRREALAVLSECRDSGADAYIRELRRQPALGSEFKAVRDEMNDLF